MTMSTADAPSDLHGIYALVDTAVTASPLLYLHDLLDGGVRLVQLRSKAGVDRRLVRAMADACRPFAARLIVNDDLEAALDADGLHVGQEDLAKVHVGLLRRRLANRILGVSCGVPAEAVVAEAAGADYVGVGPYAATATKADAGAAIGAGGIEAVVRATRLPVAAIGGICIGDLPAVAATGAAMAALVTALARAADPVAAARSAVAAWSAAR